MVQALNVNTPVTLDAQPVDNRFCVKASDMNATITINAQCLTRPMQLCVHNANVTLDISASLICKVGSDEWEYFLVTQGPFVVEDGYFLVKKTTT